MLQVANGLIRTDGQHLAPTPLALGQRTLLLTLAILTGVAWLLTIWQTQTMSNSSGGGMDERGLHHFHNVSLNGAANLASSGMAGAGWSLSGVVAFVVAWLVMMAAMMFPGLTPMLLTMRAIAWHRHEPRRARHTMIVFVIGYLLVWLAVGGLLWAVVQVAGSAASPSVLGDRSQWAPLFLGSTLIVAGLYQFTPFKQRCLDHCRSPFIVVMQRWREGYGGALRMGIGHGLYCLGCCWALFTVLVAAGIMSLAWMLALTLIDTAEKVLPMGRRVGQAAGVSLLVLGVAVVARVITLPSVF